MTAIFQKFPWIPCPLTMLHILYADVQPSPGTLPQRTIEPLRVSLLQNWKFSYVQNH